MRESDIINWLMTEIESYCTSSSYLSLETPSDHVDIDKGREPPRYPFIGIRPIAGGSDNAGIGNGELHVHDTTYSDGVLQSITYRRDERLRVEIDPTTDGNHKLRDELTTDLKDHFSLIFRTENHSDEIDGGSVGEATPQDRPDEFVRSDGLPITIQYEHYLIDSDPDVADTVNLDVNVDDDGSYGDADDTDAFDETF